MAVKSVLVICIVYFMKIHTINAQLCGTTVCPVECECDANQTCICSSTVTTTSLRIFTATAATDGQPESETFTTTSTTTLPRLLSETSALRPTEQFLSVTSVSSTLPVFDTTSTTTRTAIAFSETDATGTGIPFTFPASTTKTTMTISTTTTRTHIAISETDVTPTLMPLPVVSTASTTKTTVATSTTKTLSSYTETSFKIPTIIMSTMTSTTATFTASATRTPLSTSATSVVSTSSKEITTTTSKSTRHHASNWNFGISLIFTLEHSEGGGDICNSSTTDKFITAVKASLLELNAGFDGIGALCEKDDGFDLVNVALQYDTEADARRNYTELKKQGVSVTVDGRRYHAEEKALGFDQETHVTENNHVNTIVMVTVALIVLLSLGGLYALTQKKLGESRGNFIVSNIQLRVHHESEYKDYAFQEILLRKPPNGRDSWVVWTQDGVFRPTKLQFVILFEDTSSSVGSHSLEFSLHTVTPRNRKNLLHESLDSAMSSITWTWENENPCCVEFPPTQRMRFNGAKAKSESQIGIFEEKVHRVRIKWAGGLSSDNIYEFEIFSGKKRMDFFKLTQQPSKSGWIKSTIQESATIQESEFVSGPPPAVVLNPSLQHTDFANSVSKNTVLGRNEIEGSRNRYERMPVSSNPVYSNPMYNPMEYAATSPSYISSPSVGSSPNVQYSELPFGNANNVILGGLELEHDTEKLIHADYIGSPVLSSHSELYSSSPFEGNSSECEGIPNEGPDVVDEMLSMMAAKDGLPPAAVTTSTNMDRPISIVSGSSLRHQPNIHLQSEPNLVTNARISDTFLEWLDPGSQDYLQIDPQEYSV
eukprot:m.146012 g.146012  ORF g.146012 m.146012 type:complete len:824 (-) comp14960_c1_seq2:76-2547(-)